MSFLIAEVNASAIIKARAIIDNAIPIPNSADGGSSAGGENSNLLIHNNYQQYHI